MTQSYAYDVYVRDFASGVVNKIAANTGKAFTRMVDSQKRFDAGNRRSTNSIDRLENRLQSFREKRNASFSTKEIAKFNGYIRSTETQLRKLENLPRPSFRQRLSGISGNLSGMIGLAGGVGVALGAWRSITGVTRLGAEMEQTKISFEVMLGSARKANKMVTDLNRFANVTPFRNEDLFQNAKLLLNFGIAGNKVLPTLKKIGDVSGGNKDRFNRLSLAYSQTASMGKLMGQDLLQMINAGFNPLQVISEKTGESMSSLKDKMSQGGITARMVEEAFTIATSKGGKFFGMMNRQSTTASGKYSTFMGKLSNLGIQIGTKLLPVGKRLLDWGIGMVDWLTVLPQHFSTTKQWVDDNAVSLGLLGVAVTAFSSRMIIAKSVTIAYGIATNIVTGITKVATAGQWLWNAALTANPIGLVVAGVAALGAAAVWAYKKVGWFRGGIDASWVAIKGFGGAIKTYALTRIGELLRGITGIGSALWKFVKGDWKDAIATGKQATKDLLGIESKGKFIADMKDTGKKAGIAYRSAVIDVANEKKSKEAFSKVTPGQKNFKLKGFTALPFGDDNTGASEASTLGSSSAVTSGINAISGGGKKQTNITIQIQSLVEELKIVSQNISEGADELEDKVKEIFLRVVNSANQYQTN